MTCTTLWLAACLGSLQGVTKGTLSQSDNTRRLHKDLGSPNKASQRIPPTTTFYVHSKANWLCTSYVYPILLGQVFHTKAHPLTPGLGAIEYLSRRMAFVRPTRINDLDMCGAFCPLLCGVEHGLLGHTLSIIGHPRLTGLGQPNLTSWLVRDNGGKPLIRMLVGGRQTRWCHQFFRKPQVEYPQLQVEI